MKRQDGQGREADGRVDGHHGLPARVQEPLHLEPRSGRLIYGEYGPRCEAPALATGTTIEEAQ